MELFSQALVSMTNLILFVFGVVFVYWWIWIPLFLFVVYAEALKKYNQKVYKNGLKWITYELRIPIDAHKSLKAMEQIFAGLHVVGQGSPPKNLWEKYKKWRDVFFKGKVPDWFALEIVGSGGEIYFYIRVIEKYKSLVEAQIYAQYPESELTPVTDYMLRFPTSLSYEDVNVNALELVFIKEDIFPIKTYPEFEEEGAGKDDVRRIDPLAPIAETLGGMGLSEFFGIQIVARSTGDAWVKKGQSAIDKLMGREEKKKTTFADSVFTGIESGARSVAGTVFEPAEPSKEKEEKKKEDKPFNQLNPGVQEIIKTIEKGTAKLAFEAGIRLVYIAPIDKYDDGRMRSIAGAFKQFATQALNGFKPGISTDISKGFNKARRSLKNKKKIYSRYRGRSFPDKPLVLNTEELTTIFHIPDVGVKTPALPRIETKKGEAPAGIPIV
ncbi:MAG: hypothetical protein A2735_00750 [Candidatus Yanofskybacteria bacterium RIFCSPHIGHO2_01_FULL_41_21]|uniref:DUF8128 domain-containing protein n=1 Tax=Candidatus Yanofskybacteria bacterium RIFCSPHIGHO2_01_FULL_41_21 TaxID=1802660 RepID=A0A1F8EBP9_9BACT|nr:MAG: hypothetical protein A2735_00750 [Candidatus Yanofskybacteria bacterium RIFCSPHIGHO2_01_FULL_41_21]